MDSKNTFTHRIFTVCAIVSLFAFLIFLFVTCFNILLLILAGTMIAIYFRGIALWLSEKTKLSEKLSVFIVVAGTLIIATALFWLLGAQIQDQLSQLADKLPDSVNDAKNKLSQTTFGREVLNLTKDSDISNSDILNRVMEVFKTTFGVVGDIYIIIFLGIFLSATPYLYKRGIIRLVPPRGKEKADDILNKLGLTLRNWLVGRIFAMFVVFILTAIGLLIMGMPAPLALAFIAGLLNFIPNFGPVIALIPAVLIASLNSPGSIIIVIIVYTGIQILESSLITPLVQKRLINMAPALIIIGQVVMGVFTGLLGLLLATPIIAILMVLINNLYIKEEAELKNQ